VTGGLGYVGANDVIPYALVVLATVLVAAGPALVAAGCIWPATLALAGDGSETGAAAGAGTTGHRVGILAAANTIGAVAGGVVTPFIVLPALGPWGGFLPSAAAAALAAIALLRDDGQPRWARRWRRPGLVLGGALMILLVANPLALPLARRAAGERVLEEHGGAAATVTVVERAGERLIRLDGHYALGGTGELRHEARQGHVPLVLHGRPKRVAFVGTATGITASAALDHDVDSVTLVEIVPEVAEAATAHFADANRGIYTDARSRVVLDDARNYWRHTTDRYDVIVADLFVPWQAGTGPLYTREHFQAMRDRLEPGGLVAQWLPVYQLSAPELRTIVATFTDVFPVAAVFRNDFFATFPVVALVGWRDGPAAATQVAAAVRRLAARGVHDRWLTDPVAFFALYLAPLDPSAYDGVPRNLLDRPWIEYEAAARHAGGERGKRDALRGDPWLAQVEAWQATAAEPDPLYPSLPPPARRARAGGDALQRAGALWAAGRDADAARALEIAAGALPPSIVADAPADPSAADVWH
jgi:spermidine synthase